MLGYFYIENCVDNLKAMSTSPEVLYTNNYSFSEGFYYLRGIFFFGRKNESLPNIKYLNYVCE